MRVLRDGRYCDMDPSEIAEFQKQSAIHHAYENSRPLTADEVTAMLITAQINTLAVDDSTALRMQSFYPEWELGTAYTVGFKAQWNGALWRVRQAHTSQSGWEPENATSLWEQINETHTGELTDPIPYSGNMELKVDLYYVQGGVVYRCIRDTGNPVHHALKDLVGLYVEKV